MARGLRAWLGGWLLVAATALGMVPPPENVRMNSVNFKNVLEWESPAFPNGTLTFTAQYLSYKKFQDRCVGTANTECDFSELSKYGNHTLRVRAERGDEHSAWVTISFYPIDDTAIGPPGLQVEAVANSLHVRFLAPRIEKEHEKWTMKSMFRTWVYSVEYWRNGSDSKHALTCHYDFEVLRNLAPWTTYCVRARGSLPERNRTGRWSAPVCEGTASAAGESARARFPGWAPRHREPGSRPTRRAPRHREQGAGWATVTATSLGGRPALASRGVPGPPAACYRQPGAGRCPPWPAWRGGVPHERLFRSRRRHGERRPVEAGPLALCSLRSFLPRPWGV